MDHDPARPHALVADFPPAQGSARAQDQLGGREYRRESGPGWFKLCRDHSLKDMERADMGWLRQHGLDPADVPYGTRVSWGRDPGMWFLFAYETNENGRHFVRNGDMARVGIMFPALRVEGRVVMPDGYEGWRPE